MTYQPLISVVIVNFNYGCYLAECIDSVLAQTYPNVEVIVVDDGSTDNSLKVLESYEGRIVIVRQNNQGVSSARNTGIRMSKGVWVAFLDSDDLWKPQKLQEQSAWFRDSQVAMVFCGMEQIDQSGRHLGYSKPASGADLLPGLVTFSSPPIGGGSTVVARLAVVRDLDGFDESLSAGEDLDMWIRIGAQWKIGAARHPLIKHRIHADSLSRDLNRFERDNCRVLMKVFSNPACIRVHQLRRRAFARLYTILACSCFHNGAPGRAIRYAWKALVYRPCEITYLFGFPLRVIRRLTASPAA
jgi:glycosyltransferase involved in cell wall biosynthesis